VDPMFLITVLNTVFKVLLPHPCSCRGQKAESRARGRRWGEEGWGKGCGA